MQPEIIAHPKSPESKDDDDEVDHVGEEHERVDVSGSPILGVEDTPEEVLGWLVNAVNAGGKRSTLGAEGAGMLLLKDWLADLFFKTPNLYDINQREVSCLPTHQDVFELLQRRHQFPTSCFSPNSFLSLFCWYFIGFRGVSRGR